MNGLAWLARHVIFSCVSCFVRCTYVQGNPLVRTYVQCILQYLEHSFCQAFPPTFSGPPMAPLFRLAAAFRCLLTTGMALPPFTSIKPSSGLAVNAPAVIVIQEWWGINDQIKAHAQKVADMTGAEAIVPDLYKGKLGLNAEEASHLKNNLDFKNAVDEIEQICEDLRKDDADRKIGVTGFCMGGALSFATAALVKKPLAACAPFYGIPSAELCDVAVIPSKTPVQGHFGDLDPLENFSDKASATKLEETLKAASGDKEVEIFHYEKEGHAFMNTDDFSVEQRKALHFPGDFDPKTQELAWGRLSDFLRKNLF
jgi:carboxymethylenebutenolidase